MAFSSVSTGTSHIHAQNRLVQRVVGAHPEEVRCIGHSCRGDIYTGLLPGELDVAQPEDCGGDPEDLIRLGLGFLKEKVYRRVN